MGQNCTTSREKKLRRLSASAVVVRDVTEEVETKIQYKVLLIGESGVGKTSIMNQIRLGKFYENVASTIGVDISSQFFNLHDKVICCQIWDSAGQEKFRSVSAAYYRNAHGIVMVFDMTCRESFYNLSRWIQDITKFHTTPPGVEDAAGAKLLPIIIVGNKKDLNKSVIKREQVNEFIASISSEYPNVIFLEISAKSHEEVREVFKKMAFLIYSNYSSTLHQNAPQTSATNVQ